jgi:hypothetical protein
MSGVKQLETAKGIIDYFPINEILFILAAGVFTVLSFPYDVFQLFSDSQSAQFSLWYGIPIPKLSDISAYYKPFGNLHYLNLNNFATGLAFVIFLSLIVGSIVYCSTGIFEWINRRLSWGYRGVYKKILGKGKDEKKKDWISINDETNFYRWVSINHLDRHVEYAASMRQVNVAFLYSSEILLLSTLLSGFLMTKAFFNLWFGWAIIIALISAFVFCIYEVYESHYWRSLNTFVRLYRIDCDSAILNIAENSKL